MCYESEHIYNTMEILNEYQHSNEIVLDQKEQLYHYQRVPVRLLLFLPHPGPVTNLIVEHIL
jgi:hypothetical protein